MHQLHLDLQTRDKVIVEIHVQEFLALRQEIVSLQEIAFKILSIYLTALAIAAGLIFSQTVRPGMAIIIAFVAPFFAFAWIRNWSDVRRLGVYIGININSRLKDILGSSNILGWESNSVTYHERKGSQIMDRLIPIALFLFPALASAIIPAIYLRSSMQWLLCYIALGLNDIWLILWLRMPDPYKAYSHNSKNTGNQPVSQN